MKFCQFWIDFNIYGSIHVIIPNHMSCLNWKIRSVINYNSQCIQCFQWEWGMKSDNPYTFSLAKTYPSKWQDQKWIHISFSQGHGLLVSLTAYIFMNHTQIVYFITPSMILIAQQCTQSIVSKYIPINQYHSLHFVIMTLSANVIIQHSDEACLL